MLTRLKTLAIAGFIVACAKVRPGGVADMKAKSVRKKLKDKGFAAALSAFTNAVRNSGPAPIDESELIESSLATLAVLESLQSGARIDM